MSRTVQTMQIFQSCQCLSLNMQSDACQSVLQTWARCQTWIAALIAYSGSPDSACRGTWQRPAIFLCKKETRWNKQVCKSRRLANLSWWEVQAINYVPCRLKNVLLTKLFASVLWVISLFTNSLESIHCLNVTQFLPHFHFLACPPLKKLFQLYSSSLQNSNTPHMQFSVHVVQCLAFCKCTEEKMSEEHRLSPS